MLILNGKIRLSSYSVFSDNHLGYAEKDAIRGEDSFIAFEEVLQHAVEQKVRSSSHLKYNSYCFFIACLSLIIGTGIY